MIHNSPCNLIDCDEYLRHLNLCRDKPIKKTGTTLAFAQYTTEFTTTFAEFIS